MSIQDLGAIGEIIGAIAIVISFIYLASQVKVANKNIEMQAGINAGAQAFSAYDPVYQGRNAEIFRLGLEDETKLSANDAFVFDLLMHRQMGAMTNFVNYLGLSLVSSEDIEGNKRHYGSIFNAPGAKRWFREAISRNAVMTNEEELARIFGINLNEGSS